jgi:hypothetical protein
MKVQPKLAKKDLWKKITELSNLGAFNNHKYYDLIADKLNIPNINEKKATELFRFTQELQKLTEETRSRNNPNQT